MKLLLINPSVGYYTRALSNPLGLLSIASYVKKNGHEVRLEDRCVNKVDINKLLKEYKPDIVGISLMSSRGILDAANKTIKVNRGITAKELKANIVTDGTKIYVYKECLFIKNSNFVRMW